MILKIKDISEDTDKRIDEFRKMMETKKIPNIGKTWNPQYRNPWNRSKKKFKRLKPPLEIYVTD